MGGGGGGEESAVGTRKFCISLNLSVLVEGSGGVFRGGGGDWEG